MMNIAMKPMANSIGVLNCSEPPHIVPIQLKIFTPVGMAISIVASEKKVSASGPMPGGEHVVRPDAEAQEGDESAGEDHRAVAEERLAREDRQDLGDDPECREDQDVHLGVSEHPEEVLPEHRVAAASPREEVRTRTSGRPSTESARP